MSSGPSLVSRARLTEQLERAVGTLMVEEPNYRPSWVPPQRQPSCDTSSLYEQAWAFLRLPT